MKLPTPVKIDKSVECFSLNRSTSYPSRCLSLNSFCDETSRTWVSLSPETMCVISVKTEFKSQSELHGFSNFHMGDFFLFLRRQRGRSECPSCSDPFLHNCACMLSHFSQVWLCATPRTAAHQAPLSMGFSRQEYWSGLSFPSLGIFSTQGSNRSLQHCRQMLYRLSHQGFNRSDKYFIQ